MKLRNLLLKIISLLFLLILSGKCQTGNETPKTMPDPKKDAGDIIYERIVNKIYEAAEQQMKNPNFIAQKKLNGYLPHGNPEELRTAGKQMRMDKRKYRALMADPTQLEKVCVYPFTKVNFFKWCVNGYFDSNKKDIACKHSFCQVCCDNLAFVYETASPNIPNLISNDQGLSAIQKVIDTAVIDKCKKGCQEAYPMDMPKPELKTPRDSNLGKSKNRPGISCADIKDWGAETGKSGKYWIDVKSQGKIQVFCDMETDNGGWTLLLNYIHQPGTDVVLNGNKFPDLKTNSHMYLDNAGFVKKDARELRFHCIERYNGQNKFWHFKTSNPEIITVAMTGNQKGLMPKSLLSKYVPLPQIKGKKSYKKVVEDNNQLPAFNYFGQSPAGGFTTRAFGSARYAAYWTIKGDNPESDIFECGSNHESPAGFTSVEKHPSMVYTHHMIWFRGDSLSRADARKRYIMNETKGKPENSKKYEKTEQINDEQEENQLLTPQDQDTDNASKYDESPPESKPPVDDNKPAGEEKKPAGEESKPAGEESKPLGQESKSPEEENKPPGEESKPLGQESKPLGQESKPLGQESKPLGQESKPPEEENKPPGEESKPPGEENKSEENKTPGDENKPPGEENKPPGEENKPEGEENKPPGEENKPAGEENKPEGEENKPAGEENKPAGEENKPEGEENKPEGKENSQKTESTKTSRRYHYYRY